VAKKKKEKVADYNAGIVNENIADACQGYMEIFGVNNNIMRHLPEVLDGLLIGERRILYTMYIKGLSYNSARTKVKNIVGQTMLFHPHGDAAIEATLVKLAQEWSNMQKFIDGKGNFGSPAGDPPASGRYTEARLSYYAYKCFFEEFTPYIVNMKRNYSDNADEPEYLPSKYPNALINKNFGIGYGVSTSIPTYNFKECCEAAIELIKDPNYEPILVPDSPTGAYVVDEGQFEEISRTGQGNYKMRGVIDIDEKENSLIITSTPLMVYWMSIKENIIKTLGYVEKKNGNVDNKSSMIKCIIDKSNDLDMKFIIVLKKEIDPYMARNLIYSKTQMEKTFNVNFRMIKNYVECEYNIKSLLQTWINFRRATKRRFYIHKLVSLKERIHILDILIMILNKDNAEKTVTIFKKSENTKETAKTLMKTYGISSLQAKTIADMKFSALTKEAYKKYVKEREDKIKQAEETEAIIVKSKKIDKIIINELKEGIELFGEDRRSPIITIDNEVLYKNTEHTLAFTAGGMVKKLPSTIETIGKLTPGDYVRSIIRKINNVDDLLMFDTTGKAIKLPVHKINNSVLDGFGTKLNDYCNAYGNIIWASKKPDKAFYKESKKRKVEPSYLLITKNGYIKKISTKAFDDMRSELTSIVLKNDDKLAAVNLVIYDDIDVVVYTNKGRAARFNISDVNETGRMSMGVIATTLDDGEYIMGMITVSSDVTDIGGDKLFVITRKGYCKKFNTDIMVSKNRNSVPAKVISLGQGDELADMCKIIDGHDIVLHTGQGVTYTVNTNEDVSELPKLSKGKRLNLPAKDFIICAQSM
jgi:DNA gyrase subunit A